MKPLRFCTITLLAGIFCFILPARSQSPEGTKEGLKQHLYTLADDSLRGRSAGSLYADMAASYIATRFSELGIEPYSENGYFHYFYPSWANHGEENAYKNIIGIIPGTDPRLKSEYIVLGAHYDHLGTKIKKDELIVYNGADDNASGVSALIETARILKIRESEGNLPRSIILVAFDAEEIGLVGSKAFMDDELYPSASIKAMINLDMVGWYKESGNLIIYGPGMIDNYKELFYRPSIAGHSLNIKIKKLETNPMWASDNAPFATKGIPAFLLTTGTKSPYHKPEDTADLIDYDALVDIVEYVSELTVGMANEAELKPSGRVAAKHASRDKRFTFAVRLDIGSNLNYYTAGNLNGKHKFTFGAGLYGQVNFKGFALRPEVIYERTGSRNHLGSLWTDGITVPFNFVLTTPPSSAMGVDIFFGGYYKYLFNGRQSGSAMDFSNVYYRNEGGVNLGMTIRIMNYGIGFTTRWGLTDFLRHDVDQANIRNRSTSLSLYYVF